MKTLIRNFPMSFLMVGHTHEDVDQEFYHEFSNGRTPHEDVDQEFYHKFPNGRPYT